MLCSYYYFNILTVLSKLLTLRLLLLGNGSEGSEEAVGRKKNCNCERDTDATIGEGGDAMMQLCERSVCGERKMTDTFALEGRLDVTGERRPT